METVLIWGSIMFDNYEWCDAFCQCHDKVANALTDALLKLK